MAKTCNRCGHDHDDSAEQCVCGNPLVPEAAASSAVPVTTVPVGRPLAPEPRYLLLRRIVFVVWALGLPPLYAALRTRLPGAPLPRCLVAAAIFWVTAVAALWLLGRERQRTLRAWRVGFVVWGMLLLPLILTMADGLAAEGWPAGRFNRQIAHILTLLLVLTVPAFLTSLGALLRAYRTTAALAAATGLAYVVNGVLLLRATAPAKGLRLQFQSVLDLVLFSAQIASYASIPVGVALVVGGIMTFRAVARRNQRATAEPIAA